MTASTTRRPVAANTVLTEQDAVKLAAVYLNVVWNWAVYAEEIVEAINAEQDERFTNTNVTAVNSMLRQLGALGLVTSTNVNGERKLTWQSYFDIENEADAEENAEAAFIEAVAPLTVAGSKLPTRAAGTGPRYTEAQITAGLKARAEGKTNKAVAEAAGVKSPNYFAKVLKDREVRGIGRVASNTRRVRAAEKAREAAQSN